MDEILKRQKITHYFLGIVPQFPKLVIILAGIGGFFLLGCLGCAGIVAAMASNNNGNPAGGIFPALIGIGIAVVTGGIAVILIINWSNKKKAFWTSMPSPTDLDTWRLEDFKTIQTRANQRCGLDESQKAADPIYLWAIESGFSEMAPLNFWTKCRIQYRPQIKGDGYRSAAFQYTVIFITEKTLHWYRAVWSMIPDAANATSLFIGRENVQEYYLKDVTSVSTDRRVREHNSSALSAMKSLGLMPQEEETLQLGVAGGERESFSVQQHIRIGNQTLKMHLPSTDVEKAVASIRALLRSAKQQ